MTGVIHSYLFVLSVETVPVMLILPGTLHRTVMEDTGGR